MTAPDHFAETELNILRRRGPSTYDLCPSGTAKGGTVQFLGPSLEFPNLISQITLARGVASDPAPPQGLTLNVGLTLMNALLRGIGAATLLAVAGPSPSYSAIRARRTRCPLGEFEQQVMTAVVDCQPEAYGVNISVRLLDVYGASLALAQVYVTLKQLHGKGFLTVHPETSPRPIPGGRKRTCYQLTSKGVKALEESAAFRNALASNMRSLEQDDGKTRGMLPAHT